MEITKSSVNISDFKNSVKFSVSLCILWVSNMINSVKFTESFSASFNLVVQVIKGVKIIFDPKMVIFGSKNYFYCEFLKVTVSFKFTVIY